MIVFNNPIFSYLYFWGWRDLIEVLLFITILYKTTVWLNKDKTRNLVWYLYSYCTLILITYSLPMPFAFHFLIQASPAIAIIGILMHQESLQKRFAMPTKIVPAQLSNQWVDELLQACLTAMNSNKQIICVIEHQDSLENLITASHQLHTPCKKNVLTLLIESSQFEQKKFIFMSCDGTIKGINCNWLDIQEDNWTQATSLCNKTDMLALKANAHRNTFDIVLHGNSIENLSSTHCRSVLLQFIHKAQTEVKNRTFIPNQKEKSHEKNNS